MTTKLMSCIFLSLVIMSSCSKKSDIETMTIDVSKQWTIDHEGAVISSLGDGQWQSKIFTEQELNLFSSLDTANLIGTTTPDSVLESPPEYNSSFPNPFIIFNTLSIKFASGYSGEVVFKCVVVDSTMTSHFKLATRLTASSSTIAIALSPTIPVGRFRFYYTLSSQANPHFYTSWGNIEKVP